MPTTRSVIRVTDDTTRAELAITLGLLNEAARAISRRGPIGIGSKAYEIQHGRIDSVLDAYEQAKA